REDLATQKAIADDQRVGAEVLVLEDRVEDRPLDELAIDLDPARASWSIARARTNHVSEPWQVLGPEIAHQLAERRRRLAIVSELRCAESRYVRRRRDRFEAVLVIARVDDPHQLDEERVELKRVVTAVGAHERNRGRRPRLDALHLLPERANLGAQP